MPNIKSSSKRVQIGQARNARNRAGRSLLKTNLKKFDAAVASGSPENMNNAHKVAVKTVDKAVSKGLIHKNTAARRKRKMAKRLNAIAND